MQVIAAAHLAAMAAQLNEATCRSAIEACILQMRFLRAAAQAYRATDGIKCCVQP